MEQALLVLAIAMLIWAAVGVGRQAPPTEGNTAGAGREMWASARSVRQPDHPSPVNPRFPEHD